MDVKLQQEIIAFLTQVPQLKGRDGRRSILRALKIDSKLPNLDFSGSPEEFITRLVQLIAESPDRTPCLIDLLKDLKMSADSGSREGEILQRFHDCISLPPLPPPKAPISKMFICHVSEDNNVVKSLAEALKKEWISVFYETVTGQEQLGFAIERGLTKSPFGLMFLSPHFFNRNLSQGELVHIMIRAMTSEQLLLPVLHNVTEEDVRQFSPDLGNMEDILVIPQGHAIETVVPQILRKMFEVKQRFEFKIRSRTREQRKEQWQHIEYLGKGTKLEMVEVSGGRFTMGAPKSEEDSDDNERPHHKVSVRPFYMSKYPVTQEQWRRVVESVPVVHRELRVRPFNFRPGVAKGRLRPAENITWDEAIKFCKRLSKLTGRNYRLPTEAEWEYACRAGTKTPFHLGKTITPCVANYKGEGTEAFRDSFKLTKARSDNLQKEIPEIILNKLKETLLNKEFCSEKTFWSAVLRLADNGREKKQLSKYKKCILDETRGIYHQGTIKVTSCLPNTFGVYGMHGNVWEWCLDRWHDDYRGAPDDGGSWESTLATESRVLRGGSWSDPPDKLRSACRKRGLQDKRGSEWGFRLVCSPLPEKKPSYHSEKRRIDITVPRHMMVEKPVKLSIKVCSPDSPQLNEKNCRTYSKLFIVYFPINQQTYQFDSKKLLFQIEAPSEITISSKVRKEVNISATSRSTKISFKLTPKEPVKGNIRLIVDHISRADLRDDDLFSHDVSLSLPVVVKECKKEPPKKITEPPPMGGIDILPPEESPEEELGPLEKPPEEELGPSEKPPSEKPPEEELGPSEKPPEEELGPLEKPPEEELGPSEKPPLEESPEEELGPLEKPPEEELGPLEKPPEEELGPLEKPPEEELGPLEKPPLEEPPEEESGPLGEQTPEPRKREIPDNLPTSPWNIQVGQDYFEYVEGNVFIGPVIRPLLEQGRSKILHNLPQPDYSKFIGRELELANVTRILRSCLHSQHAIVTIDGISGVGKSALALEIAHRYLNQYDQLAPEERFDAIIWTSAKQTVLTADGFHQRRQVLHTLQDIYTTIAIALQREDITRASPTEQDAMVIRALTQQRTLLVVDNLETVDDEMVLGFLRELPAPTKAVITTCNRIDMGVSIHLNAMSRKDGRSLILQKCEEKNVTLTNDVIGQLHDRTGGMPLALVWSVAQIGSGYSSETLLERLEQPTSDIMHFCFERAIEPIKQTPAYPLLLVLSLCADSARRETLGYATKLSERDLDNELVILEKFSLVNKQEDRFWLLPLTKGYAVAEFEKYPKREQLREKWIEYFRRLCKEYGGEYWNWGNYDWLFAEGENILAIVDWAIKHNNKETALVFTRAILFYSDQTHRWFRLIPYGAKFYNIARSSSDSRTQAWICVYWLAGAYVEQGEFEQAEKYAKQGCELYEELNDEQEIWFAKSQLGRVYRYSQKDEEAKKTLENTLKLARQLNNNYGVATISYELGKLFAHSKEFQDLEKAQKYLEFGLSSYKVYKEERDKFEMLIRGTLGLVQFQIGRQQNQEKLIKKGKSLLEEELAFFEQRKAVRYTINQHWWLAEMEKTLGNHEKAITHVEKTISLAKRLHMKRGLKEAQNLLEKLNNKPTDPQSQEETHDSFR